MKSPSDDPAIPLRSPRGGRPPQSIAAGLSAHILTVALAEFGRHGIERTTMDMIAAAGNVSKRTLYLRFSSKQNLLLGVIEQAFERHIDPISFAPVPPGPVRERLFGVAASMLDASLRPEILVLGDLISWVNEHAPEVAVRTRQMLDEGPLRLFRSIVEDAIAAHEIATPDVDFTAGFVADSLVRIPRLRIMTGHMANDPALKRDYLERVLDLLLKGLAP